MSIAEMPRRPLFSLSEAAKRLGASRNTLAVLVRVHQIPTQPLPSNARAKGLTLASFHRLRRAWDEYQRGTQQT